MAVTAASLVVRVAADTKQAEGGLTRMAGLVSGFGGTVGKVSAVAVAGFAGIGAAIGAGLGFAVNSAADFEQIMSGVGAVTGASGKDMDDMRKLALKMGKDTSFSAKQAAQAMENLAKGGLSPASIQAGALKGTLDLAAAGGLDLARAATIAADSLNVFSLGGEQMGRVADTMAAAANSSSIEVEDVASSLKFIGPVAASAGFSIEQTTAAIAALGAQGIKGEQAGTALRGVLGSIVGPSEIARKKMNELGLSFFDSSGHVKDFAGISEELRTKLGGLTDAQRLQALETIFGRESMTAALALMKEGGKGIDDWTAKVSVQGEAQRVAAEKLNNFRGSMEQLKGSIETAAITLGTAFLPILRQLVDGLTAGVNKVIPFVEAWGPRFAGAIQAGLARVGQIIEAFLPVPQKIIDAFKTGDFNSVFGPFVTAIDQAFGLGSAAKVLGFIDVILRGMQLARDTFITIQQAWSGQWVPDSSIQPTVNAIGNLVLAIRSAKDTFVNEWLPVIQTQVIPALTDLWSKITNELVPSIINNMIPAIQRFAGDITIGVQTSVVQLKELQTWFGNVQTSIQLFRDNAIKALDDFGVKLGDTSSKTQTWSQIHMKEMNDVATSTESSSQRSGFSLQNVQDALNNANKTATDWGKNTRGAIDAVGEAFDGLGKAIAEPINEAIKSAQTFERDFNTAFFAVQNSGVALHNALANTFTMINLKLYEAQAVVGDWRADVANELAALETAFGNWRIGVSNAINGALDTLRGLPGQIVAAVGNLGGLLVGAGADLVQGFINGINSRIGEARALAGSIAGGIVGGVKGILNIKSPSTVMADIGRDTILGFVQGMSEAERDALSKASDIASKVAGALKSGLEALTALGNFKAPKAGAVSAFGSSFTDFFEKFATWAGGWEEDVLKQSGLFADAASKAAGLLKSGAEALTSLRDFVAPPEAAVSAFGRAIADYLEKLTTIAGGFEADGLAAAVAFSEAAGKALGILKTGVDGLTALIDFKRPTDAAIGAFKFATEFLVRSLGDSAAVMDADFAASAGKWSESAGKGLVLLGNGVKGLSELADFQRPTDQAIGAFKFATEFLLQSLGDSAAVMDQKFVAAAAQWADGAGKALAILGNGIDGLTKLADFVAPSSQAIDQFAAVVAYLVRRFGEVAVQMGTEGVAQAGAFGVAANSALTAAKTGIDAFVALGKLVVPSQQAIDQLLAGVQYTVQRMGQIAAEIGTAGLAQAVAFATAAGTVFTTLKAAIELLGSLEKLKKAPMEAVDQLLSGVKGAVAKAGDLIAEAQDLERQAIRFRDTMNSARAIFAEGMGGGGGMTPAGQLAGGVAAPTAPPATGGHTVTYNSLAFNAPVYGSADFDRRVQEAMVKLDRLGA